MIIGTYFGSFYKGKSLVLQLNQQLTKPYCILCSIETA